jgi:hypothetical protein
VSEEARIRALFRQGPEDEPGDQVPDDQDAGS